MRDVDPATRRKLLAVGGSALVTAIAGCGGTEEDSDPPAATTISPAGTTTDSHTSTGATDPVGTSSTRTPTTGPEPTSDDLDLREANVVGVEVEGQGGEFRFSVTLHHDDDGEDGYANWWQVETLEGERLGRRELAHPHSSEPFTRSATIAVPGDQSCVVVRGHDQTHGYGGRAMVVALPGGRTSVVDQGSDRTRVDRGACPG